MILAGAVAVLLCAAPAAPATPAPKPPWDTSVLSADPGAMLRAARDLPPAAADTHLDILLEDDAISFDAEGGRVETYRIVFRPLTDDAAQGWGVIQTNWNPWRMQRPELRARVIAGENEVYTLDPRTVEDAAASSDDDAVFRDDRVVRAPLPAMKKGVLVEEVFVYRDREAAPGAGLMARIYLGRRSPVRQMRVSLDAPQALNLRTRIIGSEARASERVEHGRRHVELALGPVPALPEVEPLLPGDVAPWPHLSYSTGRSWKDVAAAYAKLAAPELSATSPLWPEVVALQKKKAPPAEIVRAATAELHRLTRYTGVEFGSGALVPRAPEQVLERRYGDCKDLSTLLIAQLRGAGVRAQLVLLRAGGEDAEADLPGLDSFNHAIVRVQGNPAIWVDPTAPRFVPGLLPAEDQGRFALVIDAKAAEAVRTPVGAAKDNVDREGREIVLGELGSARVRNTIESTGFFDAVRREALAALDAQARRKSYLSFAKDNYGSEDLSSFSTTDPLDFSRPLRVELEVSDAARFETHTNGIELKLERGPLFRRVPDALRASRADGDAPQPERVHDLQLPAPYWSELHYRVVLPPGFTVRDLPQGTIEQLGPATLQQKFAEEKDGTITADYKLDLTHRRWTAAEVKAFRAAVDRLFAAAVVVHIDQRADALLAAGHTREALVELRALAALHPREALHHRQLALALIQAGAGDEARAEAHRAVELGPSEVTSHTVAGYVLEHDLLGREFRKGFDWAGALAEFQRAKELNPKNEYSRVQLADLYERGPSGRYLGAGARLEDAIAEYQALRRDLQRHDDDGRLLAVLWQAQRFEEARSLAREMKPAADRNGKLVATAAATGGLQAAMDEAGRLAPADRKAALLDAGRALLAVGRIDAATDLLAKAVEAGNDLPETRAVVAALRRIERREPEPPPGDPRSLFREMLRLVNEEDLTAAQVRSMYWRHERELDEKEGPNSPLWTALTTARRQIRYTGIPSATMEAITLAMAEIGVDGDDARGWRVRARTSLGSATSQTSYMLREDGRPKGVCEGFCPAQLGAVALEMAQRGDLQGAGRWLDWASETIQAPPDPDAATVFNAFLTTWPKEGKRGLEQARLAAAILVAIREPSPAARSTLSKAIETAATARERGLLALTLARLLSNGDALSDALSAVDLAAQQFPEAQGVSDLRLRLLQRMSRWADVTREAKARLERHPNDAYALTAAANAAAATGDFDAAEGWYRKQQQAAPDTEASVLNSLAWQDLCRNRVTDATLETAQRASTLTGNKSYAILNTLAAVDAVAGKTAEARQLLRKTIEPRDQDELDPSDWLVVGLLAEADGLPRTALAAYGKIESHKDDVPVSAAALARKREAGLRAGVK